MTELGKDVEGRFGVLPNFFRLAPETPEITEKLWGFTQAAYLDNPLPSLFKERLFVYLSRFCAVRYCIARHVGFLIGLGRPAGDAHARPHSIEDVVNLLRRKLPRERELELRLSQCASCPAPLAEMPSVDSQVEDAVFTLASHVFLQTSDAPRCFDELGRLLGPVRLQYLLLFLAFVRAAHYWTKVHPEIGFEDDIKQVLAAHEALADCILNDPEAVSDNISQSLMEELPALRQRADKALGLLAAIVDSSADAIVSKNLNGVITSWNAGAERLFGYSAEEAVGQHITMLIPSDRLYEEVTIIERVTRGERIEHFDTVRVCKDGSLRDISLTISPIRNSAGKIVGASKIARDITQRKQMEGALRESEDRLRSLADALDTQVQFRTQELRRRNAEILQQAELLRSLSQRLLRTQDDERRHIARELHDSAGQTLVALNLKVSEIAKASAGNPAQFAQNIEEIQELINHLSQELRTTSYLFHPPLLDEAGLASALRWYVKGLAERSHLNVDLKISDNFERLPPETELVIFRIVQESLTNIHRHSESKTAVIRLARDAQSVIVEVQDQGKGIPPKRLAEIRSKGTGVGISGMRERLLQFGGELSIESSDHGTTVSARLPLSACATGQGVADQRGVA